MLTAAQVGAVRHQTVSHRLGVLRHASGDVLDDPAARLQISPAIQSGDGAGDRG